MPAAGVMSTEAGHECARARGARAAFADRVGQRHQFVVLVGIGGQRPGMAHEFPTARRGDTAGVLTHRSQEWGSRTVASGPTTAVESE